MSSATSPRLDTASATETPTSGAPGSKDDVVGARTGRGFARAKAILFGEHAVVYGEPAVALPVPALRVDAVARLKTARSRLDSALHHGPLDTAPIRLLPTTTAVHAVLRELGRDGAGIHIDVRSDIPAERGLGSSAAVSAAVIGAVAGAFDVELDDDTHFALTQEAERAAHGSPSGLDARAVRAAGPIWFQQGTATGLPVGAPLHLVIGDSGVRGRTREAVAAVRERREADRAAVDAVIGELGELARAARDQLAVGAHAAIGAAMDRAHTLLTRIGVGDRSLDHLAAAARSAGALGAKLTGGGRGGCLLALAEDPDHARAIADRLRAAGAADAWVSTTERTA